MRSPALHRPDFQGEAARALKVCFFSHASQLTGAERSLAELVRQLVADHRVECHVVLPEPGPLRETLELAGAVTHFLPYGKWCFPKLPDASSLREGYAQDLAAVLGAVTGFLRELEPDVIYTNTLVIPWGAVAATLLNKPHVWHIREFGRRDHGLESSPGQVEMVELIEAASHRVVTNARAVRDELFGDGGEAKATVIYNSIAVPEPVGDRAAQYQRPGAVKLLMLATIAPSKGQRDAVRAVRRLVEEGIEAELLLLGVSSSTNLRDIQELIDREGVGERVRLPGFQDDPFPTLKQADVLLVCSRNEAFGRSTLEGMLMGKVVIGTASGGTLEILEDGVTGFLYPPGDHEELARKIAYVVRNPAVAARVAAQGRAWAAGNFTPEQYGGRVHRELVELVAARQRDSVPPWSRFLVDHLVLAWGTREQEVRAALEEREAALQGTREALEKTKEALQEAEAARGALQAELARILATRWWRLRKALNALGRKLGRRGRPR